MHKSKGNAIWFDEAADKAGADVMRWLFMGHEPNNNLNFGYNTLRDVRGRFINTLWNIYSFFVNYARLSEFVPTSFHAENSSTYRPVVPFSERADFDRWILTELQDTIVRCRDAIEAYHVRGAVLAIEQFVENLSGWYVRHCRRRYWKTPDDEASQRDVRAAFETLYECLYSLIRLAAPIIPFITEEMYQNLVRGCHEDAPISVHLTSYPVPNERARDQPLTEEMRAVMRLNSLALSAREAKKIKVRQPLAKLVVGPQDKLEQRAATRFLEMLKTDLNVKEVHVEDPGSQSPLSYEVKPNYKALGQRAGKLMKPLAAWIADNSDALVTKLQNGTVEITADVGGESIALTASDLQLVANAPETLSVVEDRRTWVAIETTITDDLRLEGLMRDLLRRLQMLRKEVGLEIEDRIHLTWQSDSQDVNAVFARWQGYLADELLCVGIDRLQSAKPVPAEPQAVKVSGEPVTIWIRRNASA